MDSSDPFDADISAIPHDEDPLYQQLPPGEIGDDDLNISNITVADDRLYQKEMAGESDEEMGDKDEDDPLNTAFCVYSDDDAA